MVKRKKKVNDDNKKNEGNIKGVINYVLLSFLAMFFYCLTGYQHNFLLAIPPCFLATLHGKRKHFEIQKKTGKLDPIT
jgi:hypothetical protein